jgi:hypothetical protein
MLKSPGSWTLYLTQQRRLGLQPDRRFDLFLEGELIELERAI